jgi:hypothetical protein
MSLGFDDAYNKRLREKLKEFDNPIALNGSQPEMFFRQAQSDFILPMVKPSFPTLALALKAERGISLAQGQGMEGEGLKSFVKGVEKGAKKVAKGVKKVAKSKAVKAVGKVAKEVGKSVGTVAFDEAEKLAGPALGTLGALGATLSGNPELAPLVATLGAKVGEDLGKKGRKYIKKKTGMGLPSKWIQHVKEYAKENKVPYKQAMKEAKETYKK